MERAVGDACRIRGGEPGSRERAYQRSATRRNVVAFALAGAFALVGCERRERLQRDEPLITAAPDAVDAGTVWVGFPREFSVTYRNDGKPGQTLWISSSDPRAIPTAAAFDDNVVVTRVSAEFLSPPDCHSTRECLEGAFNADAGVCEWRTLADGEPCASLCVANGSCVEGQCAGEAVSCPAPSSTCQQAVCSPTLGCVEVPRVCEPSSSCVSATCIEGQGGVELVREDGHYCGEPECDQDHVCLDGACRATTPPLGVQVTRCLRAKQVLVTSEGMGCAVTMDAGAICWGSVSAPFADSLCGRFPNGEVRCAGADRPFPGRSVTVQYQLDGGSVVSGMAASLSAAANGMENWTCVRMQDGTVQRRDAIGSLADKNCRTGMATDAFRPFGDHVIDADFGRTPRDGRGTLCAVRNDGLVKCLGGDRYGQAGMFNADGGPAPDYS